MKDIINSILENGGFSLGTLSKETSIERWRLYKALHNRPKYLKKYEVNILKNLIDESSYKIKMNKKILFNSIKSEKSFSPIDIFPKNTRYGFPFYTKKLENNNAQKEYYLTDLVEMIFKENSNISTVDVDFREAMGANTQEELKELEKFIPNK